MNNNLNPERIDNIMSKLLSLWLTVPNVTFGQLITFIIKNEPSELYNINDHTFSELIDDCIPNLGVKQKSINFDNVYNKIKDLAQWCFTIDKSEFNNWSVFRDFDLDEIDMIDFMLAVEDNFNIVLPEEFIPNEKLTFADVVCYTLKELQK